jgi:2-C-methyl-D-erythritol 4-phosphate cytidylyltransferase
VFRRAALERGLADDELVRSATDDAWLIEQQGGVVRVIPAGQPNFKVTTPDDLRLAELLLGAR